MPTDVSAVVHPSQKKSLGVLEFRQLAWKSDGAWVVETRWNLVVQPFVRSLIVEHVAKAIEAALLSTKRCRRRFCSVFLERAMHPLMATILLWPTCLYPLMYDPELHPA